MNSRVKTRYPDPEFIDEENPEWTEESSRRSMAFSELPSSIQENLKSTRGPQKEPTKERISIRLSREVVDEFRKTGRGWQSRIDQALKDWLKSHPQQ